MSQAPPAVQELIARFDRNLPSYKSQGYNETQLRREFLDPFFEALGWDVANKQGHAEAYKDVIHEDAIKIGGATKAPDYCFRIGRERKFFLEAKKPAINVKDEVSPAYQLRRYAWSAKLPLSVLSDFEEFAAYDCRSRPNQSDKPAIGRILYLTFREYSTRWDEIVSIFAKESVLKGSFDKYAVTDRKRGTATVDKEFLAEIDQWRTQLAKNLAARNPRLSVHDLNFSVQRTIDRVIFLRICEDRGIEPYGQLQALLNGANVYARLRHLYNQADDRYNSGLFHFSHEEDRAEAPDELTFKLKIDDKVLKDILDRLYYPKSPYEFSVFPIEILGQVYEQFLGKVIRLTAGHQAKVEDKPEVKKAGGVFYTPRYIVDYIVTHTVGVLCEGKTPKQIARLRVLDPACGSGSFLIGAFNHLMDYHQDWYVTNGPEQYKKELYKAPGGEWRLTTQEKKRILLNNIYGVDIDSQAVEVTKLSLLLKVLEGESDETLKRQLSFIHERALPDLGNNIKCGNSLIGPDYFSGQLLPDEEEMRRVNPFDWKAEFPAIMQAGGFDAVIGNPPYVRVGNIDKSGLPYLYKKYDIAHRFDIYIVFVLKGYELLSNKGRLGFILPNKFFTADYGKSLRAFLRSRKAVETVVDFGDSQVFAGATTYTCLLFLNREPQNIVRYLTSQDGALEIEHGESAAVEVELAQLDDHSWSFLSSSSSRLLGKLKEFPSLGDVCEIERGLETGCDEVFFLQIAPAAGTKNCVLVTSKVATRPFRIEKEVVRSLVKGSADIRRYFIDNVERALLFPYRHNNARPYLIEPASLARDCPFAWKYLNEHAGQLKARQRKSWYAFRRRNYDLRDGVPRILVPSIGKRLSAAVDPDGKFDFVGSGGGGGGSYGLVPKVDTRYSIFYILGLVNSKICDWLAKVANSRFGGGYYSFNRQYIEPIPIRPIDFTNLRDKMRHDEIVALVNRMLDLHKRLADADTSADKQIVQRQIDATDRDIDKLVYELYGLTAEEVKIVEAASVASSSKSGENEQHEQEPEFHDRSHAGKPAAGSMAEDTRYAGEGSGGPQESSPEAGEPIYGVRESTGEYRTPEESGGESQEELLGSTRTFETAEGMLTYTELSERLAVPLISLHDEILNSHPDQVDVTAEWLCRCHKRLAGHLFPDWAGRYRDVNVQVGAHTPPPFYEVPIHMRQFCDDLAERVKHVGRSIETQAHLLAWVDWRFQWIHPFRDFNGRIGRVLLAALLYKFGLPHVTTAPDDGESRRIYLNALRSADAGNQESLQALWLTRLVATFQEEP